MKNCYRIPFYVPLVLLLLMTSQIYSQQGFSIKNNKKKDVIPFELANNLVVVPVEINGTELSFLLDTGVSSTIVFSVASEDSLQINEASKVKLRGLGGGGFIEAYKSQNNVVRIGDAVDYNHSLYFIFENAINFSPRMGIPIHGIIGYDFFKSFVVRSNYVNKRLTIYDPATYNQKICRKCEEFPIVFHNQKPYLDVSIEADSKQEDVRLLLDSGSSDAIWLFRDEEHVKAQETLYFDDYLGFGLSGNIYGKRSRLIKASLGRFELHKVKVAYPDTEALENIKLYADRDGSLGGELLRRFHSIIDYNSGKITLWRNSSFNDPFNYNMSGLIIEHDGLTTVREVLNSEKSVPDGRNLITTDVGVSIPVKKIANVYLAPKYVVAEIRPDSPAALADIRVGDEVVSINGHSAFKYKLHEVLNIFSSKDGRRINLLVKRNGFLLIKKSFILKKML